VLATAPFFYGSITGDKHYKHPLATHLRFMKGCMTSLKEKRLQYLSCNLSAKLRVAQKQKIGKSPSKKNPASCEAG
jgi:hypothetical protein